MCACSKRGGRAATADSDDIKQKLDKVLQEMISLTDDPAEKSLVGQAKPFGHIKDLDMEAVGFTIPQKEGDHRVHVSFTLDYFREHDVKTLAQQGLEDWRSAGAHAPQQQ
jgi:hypothetical protein